MAVLGTVLLSAYRSHLSLGALPAAAADAVRSSVAGGVAVAHAAGSPALLVMVKAAYVHGLDVMLAVCAVIAIASALLALIFLPGRAAATAQATPGTPELTTDGATLPDMTAGNGAARPVATGPRSGENQGHERDRHR